MFRKLIFTLLIISLILTTPALAAGNIQYISEQASEKQIVINTGDKLMLDKQWYSYKFEINPQKNAGNLQMQSVDAKGYEEAINQVSFPLEKIGEYKVYFLNYRLKNYPTAMGLSFLDDSCVIFGTYYKLSPERLHQLAVHELGHQIDFKLMNSSKWNQYKQLRGITNEALYNNNSSEHPDRPQEIFAEDFRMLFGGEAARKIPHLNKKLPAPENVKGLKEFMLSIAA